MSTRRRDYNIHVSHDADQNWRSDAIQFPRLLAELHAIGLTPEQYAGLLMSMDLEDDELIDELLDRATDAWEWIKGHTPAPEDEVRHTACARCGTDIEGMHPFPRDGWRDRGGANRCYFKAEVRGELRERYSESKRPYHVPVKD